MTALATKKHRPAQLNAGRIIGRACLYFFLILFAVIALIPFAWMISSSLKLDKDVFRYPIEWIPAQPHWENYAIIWQRVPLLTYFQNTAFVSIVVTFMQILTSSFAAYAFAKMQFRGRDFLFLCYVGTIAVPWQVYMLPQFIMMRQLGLYDTLWALVVLQSFSAFGVFLMRQFYIGIPNELSEAARIDGASEMHTFVSIVIPMIKPGIGALAIFTFINVWNDYFLQLIMLFSRPKLTISLGIATLQAELSTDFGLIMAGAALGSVPIIIIFLIFQKYFTQGITMGAVKG
ncbi:MAG: carbohydrate ABC transporter permease [Clostridia bacterium]